MWSMSVSDLKAQLSEQLRHVKQGETVIITERGVPIARLVPIAASDRWDGDMRELMEAGQVRPGTGELPDAFWNLPAPADPDGGLRATVQAEREVGW